MANEIKPIGSTEISVMDAVVGKVMTILVQKSPPLRSSLDFVRNWNCILTSN